MAYSDEDQAWLLEHEEGPWAPDPSARAEALAWMRGRPKAVRDLMLRFPPSCVVKANRPLSVPAPGRLGQVVSYIEKEKGGVDLRVAHPDGDIGAVCDPSWLEVVGYYQGLDRETMGMLLADPESESND